MQQYNTSDNKTVTSEIKGLGQYVTREDTSKDNEGLLNYISNALFSMHHRYGIKTDHSPSHPTIMTLDIYQLQQAIVCHTDKLYTHIEIIEALYCLNEPKMMQPSTIVFNSELDGKRIDAVRLQYEPPTDEDIAIELLEFNIMKTPEGRESDTCAEALDLWRHLKQTVTDEKVDFCSQYCCIKLDALLKKNAHLTYQNKFLEQMKDLDAKSIADLKTEIDKSRRIDPDEFDMLVETNKELEISSEHFKAAANQWRDESFKHYENYETAQATITSLRSTILELMETLQAADGEARVSLTSRELLQLMITNSDSNDVAF